MKHLFRFVCGGVGYYLIEVVWRYFMNHGTPSLLMIPMGGFICVVLLWAQDKRLPILLGSFLGALTTVLSELIVGLILLDCFNKRYWCYGRINYRGVIALDWSFIWWGVCFGFLVLLRVAKWLWARHKVKKGRV